ncbi:MAG: penicillin acylase family protein [Deltaproteobacteria bacterium]|nr:penicillin acylase family protein [Candidatus Zymogenaceae bacterium]
MKIFKIALIIVSLIILAVVFGVWGYIEYLVPSPAGTVVSEKIRDGASVIIDEYGVPHIYADNTYDLYFALGYVQARDRLFQMDFYRRAANGRLAEVLGPDLVDADRYLLTMGFRRTAEVQIEHLSPELTETVNAFSDGVNAFMEENPLPVEFKILGYEPSPWTPVDSQAIGNLISFQLASWAYANEMFNYLLTTTLDEETAKAFLPRIQHDAVYITADAASPSPDTLISDTSREFLDMYVIRDRASNNWVVSGDLTESGMPILCEDSHEEGPELPTQWHLAHLSGPDVEVSGAMFPGAPIFIFGRNRHISWGVTNFDMDVQDLFLEKINPDDETQVMYDNEWVDMEIITESIPVKDDAAEGGFTTESVTIRITPHGPIINDIEDDLGETPVSLCRMGASPWPLLEGFLMLNSAKNWDEFNEAMAIYAAGPQHFVYGDVDGTIGYVAAGKCPIRTNSIGMVPMPGWDGGHDWRGFYPYGTLTILSNPDKGYIATANNPPIPESDFSVFISRNWEPSTRAARIGELIEGGVPLTTDDMAKMQMDVTSKLAQELVPIMVEILTETSTDGYEQYIEELAAWDCVSTVDSVGATLYHTTFNTLLKVVFADELGEDLFNKLLGDKSTAVSTLTRLLTIEQDSPLFDDITTDKTETVTDAVTEAFGEAVAFLTDEYGSDPENWQWGRVHPIEFAHIFGEVAPLRPFFNYGPFPFTGCDQSINRGGYDQRNPYNVNITASIRYIVDFSDLENSLIVLSTGQSGFLGSPHRTDMADMLLEGTYIPWYMDRENFEDTAEGVITFMPK